MREIIYYEAFDGDRFSDENECVEYEYKVTHIPQCLRFFDKHMNELEVGEVDDPSEACERIEDIYEKSSFLCLKETEDMDYYLDFMYSYYGFPLLPSRTAGFYKYDETTHDWREATVEDFKW